MVCNDGERLDMIWTLSIAAVVYQLNCTLEKISENSPPGSTNFTMEQLINITITQGKFHQYMGFVRLQASNEMK